LGALNVRAVVFDVGETLVDETSSWAAWARHLGVSPFTMMATLGGTIARGEPHQHAVELVAPGHDIRADRPDWEPSLDDLYADAIPCLRRLSEAGYRLGVVGNQPPSSEPFLAALGVSLDFVASSGSWGVAKPAPEFFTRVADQFALPPDQVLYVGDRLDNDILPAKAVGMRAVLIRRGPWGVMHARDPNASQADAVLASLDDLAACLT
jgi:HAD superfamily hydrolase (TIGR01662 family)